MYGGFVLLDHPLLLLPPGWDASPSQGTQHEETRSTVLLLPLDGMLVSHRLPSMKRLGVLLLPSGWDSSPSQGTQHEATIHEFFMIVTLSCKGPIVITWLSD